MQSNRRKIGSLITETYYLDSGRIGFVKLARNYGNGSGEQGVQLDRDEIKDTLTFLRELNEIMESRANG
jgi:hypothetical protein